MASLFATLYPNVMVLDAARPSLTVDTARRPTDYTLKVMTVVALRPHPVVLAYQAGPTGCSASGSAASTSRPPAPRIPSPRKGAETTTPA